MRLRLWKRANAKPSAEIEPATPPRKTRRFRRFLKRSLLVLVLLSGVLALYLNSNSFANLVRRKVIAELESATGGRVEIDSFTFSILKLRFEAQGVTIHGQEAAGQAPYFHADKITGQGKVISFFSHKLGMQSLTVDRPVLHLVVYPNGTTNQPAPKAEQSESSSVQRVFDVAIERVEINDGELLLNEQEIHFALAGGDMAVEMRYLPVEKNYDGSVNVKGLLVRYGDFQPLTGDLDLKFVLRPSQVEVKSFAFTAQRSVLRAGGTVTNFDSPEIHLQYAASLDLAEAGRITRMRQLQGGRLDVNGQATYKDRRYAAQGNIAAHSLAWRDADLNLPALDVASPYLVTEEKISLPHISSRIFSGTVQGEAQLVNWTAPSPDAKSAPGHGTVSLKLSGLQLGQMAAAVPASRLARINPAGTVTGDVKTNWLGSPRNAVTEFNFDSEPPANVSPQQMPVTARMQATYHSATQMLDVAGLNLATRSMRLNGTGTLGSTTALLQVSFNANDLQELKPMLATYSPGIQVPLQVRGRASFNGSVFGKLKALSARGRIDLQDFDVLWVLPPPLAAPGSSNALRHVQWDSLAADVSYSSSNIAMQNGTLQRGATQVGFSGSVGLVRGDFDEKLSQISVTAGVRSASIADIMLLTGIQYPVSGVWNATLHLNGTMDNLRTSGSVEASRLVIYGEPFRSFRADLVPTENETQFTNIVLSHNGSKVTGSASFNIPQKTFHFDLRAADIRLADFRHYQPERLTMEGTASFHATGSGTADAPVINGQLNFHNLVLNGEPVGDITATAETRGAEMQLRAQSNFQNANFNLDGSVRLRDDFPAQIKLRFEHLDFDPLLRAYLRGRVTGHSSMEGYMDIHGALKSARNLSVVANITQLSADVQNLKLQNSGPLRFSLVNQNVHVDEFHLVGNDVDLTVLGDAHLAGDRVLDLRTEGRLSLKLLEGFDPDLTASGGATFTLHLTGTMNQPQMRGHMDLENGAISEVDLPNGLTQIKGRVAFAQDRLQIENVTAHTGGGDLNLGGFIAYRNGVYFDMTATGKDVRLRYPPGVSASANANFRYTGSAQSSLLSGNITIVRFSVDPHFDFVQYLARAKQAAKPGSPNPFLDNLRLDLHFVSTPELRVETSLAKLSGDADLRIRGTVANPSVLGRVNIAEGNIIFNGTRYRLERGDISFNNPQLIQPIVNMEMSARVRDYDITIGFHGPIDRLSITYHSDPPLPSGDIIALLAFGRTRQEDVYTNQPTTTLTTSEALLQQAINSASSSRVQKLFGVGSVKIDPQAVGTETNLGPRVTIEQQIQNNITLTYITNLAQTSSEQVIQLEYNVSRSVSVVAVRDQNGILAFEVRIRKRKR